jgi:hypothetical protein
VGEADKIMAHATWFDGSAIAVHNTLNPIKVMPENAAMADLVRMVCIEFKDKDIMDPQYAHVSLSMPASEARRVAGLMLAAAERIEAAQSKETP